MGSILLSIWLIPIINAQTIFTPTISNSSGDYFITQQSNDFKDGEIICNSTALCSIQCTDSYSCQNSVIKCNDAARCDIYCQSGSCSSSNIHVSSSDTNIVCTGTWTCNTLTISTDYSNNPLAYTELSCLDSWSCKSMQINGYTNAASFQIYGNYGDIVSPLPESYPILSPTITNATGEYYQPTAGFLNIQCTNPALCSVDCSNGGCYNSIIDCGISDICDIKCIPGSNSARDSCKSMTIIAKDITMFSLECSIPKWNDYVCGSGNILIDNVNSVDIKCTGSSSVICSYSEYTIQNVENLNLVCDNTYSCRNGVYNIENITESMTLNCDGGCQYIDMDINNAPYLDITCQGTNSACDDININAVLTPQINITCLGIGYNCVDMSVCNTDGALSIDCIGYKTCRWGPDANFCEDISSLNINCIGGSSCPDPTMAPSIAGTLSPTIMSDEPSLSPSEMPTIMTNEPSLSPSNGPVPLPTISPSVYATTTEESSTTDYLSTTEEPDYSSMAPTDTINSSLDYSSLSPTENPVTSIPTQSPEKEIDCDKITGCETGEGNMKLASTSILICVFILMTI